MHVWENEWSAAPRRPLQRRHLGTCRAGFTGKLQIPTLMKMLPPHATLLTSGQSHVSAHKHLPKGAREHLIAAMQLRNEAEIAQDIESIPCVCAACAPGRASLKPPRKCPRTQRASTARSAPPTACTSRVRRWERRHLGGAVTPAAARCAPTCNPSAR